MITRLKGNREFVRREAGADLYRAQILGRTSWLTVKGDNVDDLNHMRLVVSVSFDDGSRRFGQWDVDDLATIWNEFMIVATGTYPDLKGLDHDIRKMATDQLPGIQYRQGAISASTEMPLVRGTYRYLVIDAVAQ